MTQGVENADLKINALCAAVPSGCLAVTKTRTGLEVMGTAIVKAIEAVASSLLSSQFKGMACLVTFTKAQSCMQYVLHLLISVSSLFVFAIRRKSTLVDHMSMIHSNYVFRVPYYVWLSFGG
jgi:hypothetical protein